MDIPALRDAFQQRNNRFGLLDRGIALAGWRGKRLRILEIGCANGAAAAHMRTEERFDLCSADIDSAAIATAAKEYAGLRFVCADACCLPFEDESFEGIFSEAAFSVIQNKTAAASEYARVLGRGGRVLVNDFILSEGRDAPAAASGVPCFDGVQTAESYIKTFAGCGMSCVYYKEHYFELLSIAASLSHSYCVSGRELGAFIGEHFGSDRFVGDFFSRSNMSYAQFIFEKDDK